MNQTNQNTEQMKQGRFIAFEGIDGSGKSTQIAMLKARLVQEGLRCYTTMEPTGSPMGSLIHQIMTGRMKADNRAIACLFAADRIDHLLNEVDGILPKIEEGITVLTDRYYFSSYAYHAVDMDMDWVIKANEQSSRLLRPTITVFIDVDADTALERIAKNRFHTELYEKRSRLVQVRDNYFVAFERLKKEENYVIIDGTESPERIAEAVWESVKGYFGK